MNLPTSTFLASLYVQINAVLLAGFLASLLVRHIRIHAPRQLVRFNYALIIACLCLPLVAHFISTRDYVRPSAQVWFAASPWEKHTVPKDQPEPVVTLAPIARPVSVGAFFGTVLKLMALAFLITASRIVYSAWLVRRVLSQCHLVHQIGRVRVSISEQDFSPFSMRTFRHAHVVLPRRLLMQRSDLKIALAHELQHHRQGDTLALYVLECLKGLFFFNPAVHLWARAIGEYQEFACDEVLVDQKKIPPQTYGRCLIEAALCAGETSLVGTASMGASLAKLKRRIDMISNAKKPANPFLAIGVGLFIGTFLVGTAFATKNSVLDRRISAAKAAQWLKNARNESGFPLDLNQEVLEWLNYYVGTPEGRRFVAESVDRMREMNEMIVPAFKKHRAPRELLAIGLTESGYKNLPEHFNPNKSAGVWQFIPTTARRFNLIVDDTQDQRLDVAKATDAALRYLSSMNLMFEDWRLSVIAYNGGEGRLQKGIKEVGSRDPWVLIEKGYGGDDGYLAKFMAAALILKNPESFN